MPKHLKTHIISRLDPAISFFVPSSRVSALHSRGVRYFHGLQRRSQARTGTQTYTRFYQYTYVAIYRQMQAERLKAQEPQNDLADLSFEPVAAEKPFSLKRPLKRPHSAAMERILHGLSPEPPPPAPQPEKTPHGTIFLAYLKKKQYLCSPK